MKRTLLTVLLVFGLYSEAALAQRHWYGAGGDSCGRWLAARARSDWFSYTNWVFGFVSAANLYERRPLRETDAEAMKVWLDEYCRKNPLEPLSGAALKLVEELRPR